METEANERSELVPAEPEEPPPFMRSWNRIYWAVALYTCALILVLYLITISLNR